jgi:hypothetical protein
MTQVSITDQFDRQTNSDSEPRRSERIFFRGNHPGLQIQMNVEGILSRTKTRNSGF